MQTRGFVRGLAGRAKAFGIPQARRQQGERQGDVQDDSGSPLVQGLLRPFLRTRN